MPQELRPQAQMEGITVAGEAVRRVSPESAEFLIELTASAPTAAQALRDVNNKSAQIAQAVAPLGVQRADIQPVSVNVYSLFSPMLGSPAFGAVPQIGPTAFSPYQAPVLQPEVQFGSYQARSALRVNVREAGRVGEVVDALSKAGASLSGGFSFRVADEPAARKAALEAAGRDARAKAETLAAAAGKQVGDPVWITEDFVVSNGAYAALRQAAPFAFGAGAPAVVGELEYYARVSASFRLA